MRDFRDLIVWKTSHRLTLKIYQVTSNFPKQELFGLTVQMRRSACSISSNIAEGCGQNTQLQLSKFLNYATGSASELEYQILLSKDLKYIDNQVFKDLTHQITQIKKMLFSLISTIKHDN